MTSYETVAWFLEEIGAQRLPDGPAPPRRRSVWRVGSKTLIVSEQAEGTIGVDEVLVVSPSISGILDVIGGLHARHIEPRENRGSVDSAAD